MASNLVLARKRASALQCLPTSRQRPHVRRRSSRSRKNAPQREAGAHQALLTGWKTSNNLARTVPGRRTALGHTTRWRHGHHGRSAYIGVVERKPGHRGCLDRRPPPRRLQSISTGCTVGPRSAPQLMVRQRIALHGLHQSGRSVLSMAAASRPQDASLGGRTSSPHMDWRDILNGKPQLLQFINNPAVVRTPSSPARVLVEIRRSWIISWPRASKSILSNVHGRLTSSTEQRQRAVY